MISRHEVTELLQAWESGDEEALSAVITAVYHELRAIAAAFMRQERPLHTLQATELVSEVYLRLIQQQRIPANREEFLAIAAHAMRRLLIDHARARLRQKRGGRQVRVPLDHVTRISEEQPERLLALDGALNRLGKVYPRESQVVVFRYFGGLKMEEIAGVLQTSRATVYRDVAFARAWLHRELSDSEDL